MLRKFGQPKRCDASWQAERLLASQKELFKVIGIICVRQLGTRLRDLEKAYVTFLYTEVET